MFPLYSDRPLERLPFVTVLLIMANIAMYLHQVTFPGGLAASVRVYGLIPMDLFNPGLMSIPGRLPSWQTLVTAMFSHGGLFHLMGNMLYLWVFGRNVEDDFGHIRFTAFYFSAGVLSTLGFAAAFPDGVIPLVGASGAIAGVLGAYFLRFPFSRIYTLFFFIIFVQILPIPAFFILGVWFFVQIASSMICVAGTAASRNCGGVAWIAHVAGFVVGIVWTILELRRRYHLRRS